VEVVGYALQLHLNRSRRDPVLIDAGIIFEDHVANEKLAIERKPLGGEVVLTIFCLFKFDRGGIGFLFLLPGGDETRFRFFRTGSSESQCKKDSKTDGGDDSSHYSSGACLYK
jgi:hypothetical protein